MERKLKPIEDLFSKKKIKKIKEAPIIIDNREKNSLAAHIVAEKIKTQFENLEIGDYQINDLTIERKSSKDLASSLFDGRLFRQLKELSGLKKKIIIIEGEIKENKSLILSIKVNYSVPVILSSCPEETAKIILDIYSKINKKSRERARKPKKTALSLEDKKEQVLESFPGIGKSTALKLLNEFKTLKRIFESEEKDLKKIKGFSKSKVSEFLRILNG